LGSIVAHWTAGSFVIVMKLFIVKIWVMPGIAKSAATIGSAAASCADRYVIGLANFDSPSPTRMELGLGVVPI
jgi:hypothetical protein